MYIAVLVIPCPRKIWMLIDSGAEKSAAIFKKYGMTTRCGLPLIASLLAALLGVQAEGAQPESAVEPCPGAAEWARHESASRKTQRTDRESDVSVSKAELIKELKTRVDGDQSARKQWLSAPQNEDLARAVDAIDAANLMWLRKLIAEQGFPTAAQVGKEGVHLAWVLLQHADQDPKLQRDLLPVLEQRYSSGELPANDLARFTDRVLISKGEPQKYGTQFDWTADEFKLPEGSRLAEIDTERKRIGLMPLADYACTIRSARDTMR